MRAKKAVQTGIANSIRPTHAQGMGMTNSSKKSSTSLFDFKIRNFPIGIWTNKKFTEDGIITSDRLVDLLEKLLDGRKYTIMDSPFSPGRLRHWISKKSEVRALNKAFDIQVELDLQHGMKVWSNPSTGLAKIYDGVYFFQHYEEFLGNSSRRHYIIFEEIKESWDVTKIRNFILKFSKELYTLWNKDFNTIGDKTAFDSVFLPDTVLKDLREDLEAFLHSRKMYEEDLDLPWKRGYMLVGPPGNGKTLLIRSICQYYGLEHFDIKRVIDNGGNLNMDAAIDGSIDNLLYPNEERPKVCVLEDIDKFTAFQSGGNNDQDYGTISLHALLRGLDGVDSYSDIILIATSNFPDVLHEAIAGRPGRFDKIYSIEKPSVENIGKLLSHYNLTFDGCTMESVAKQLDGSSMAFVAEFVKIAKMKYKRNNISSAEADGILVNIKKHQDLCKNHFKEDKRFGFNK